MAWRSAASASAGARATAGGGVGYWAGAGGYLGIALDEFGNFSNPAAICGRGCGPGQTPPWKPDYIALYRLMR